MVGRYFRFVDLRDFTLEPLVVYFALHRRRLPEAQQTHIFLACHDQFDGRRTVVARGQRVLGSGSAYHFLSVWQAAKSMFARGFTRVGVQVGRHKWLDDTFTSVEACSISFGDFSNGARTVLHAFKGITRGFCTAVPALIVAHQLPLSLLVNEAPSRAQEA